MSQNTQSVRGIRACAVTALAVFATTDACLAHAAVPSEATTPLANDRGGGEQRDDAPAANAALEEVLVTARRREERAQNVPIAITALSQETLQNNNVQTIGDLQYLVPSLSTNTANSRDGINPSIRGQGANRYGGLPGVVAYLNEVPIPTNFQGELAGGPGLLFDLENVQVLKGPQGTLFGRNSVGGAMLLQAARPTNESGGRVQAGFGNFNDREIDAAINLPIVPDTLLTRFAFNGQKRDGFTKLLASPGHPDGIDTDDRDYWSARATVAFNPDERFENSLAVTYQDYDSNGSPMLLSAVNTSHPVVAFVFPTLPGYLVQQEAAGLRTAIPVSTDYRSSGTTLSANNTTRIGLTDNLTLRNILGYVEANTVYQFDTDGTNLPIFDALDKPRDQTLQQYTEEMQILGKAFGARLDWILGGFYLDSRDQHWILRSQNAFRQHSENQARGGSKSKAVFAQGTYDLSGLLAGLSATAGVRHTWDSSFLDVRGPVPGTPLTSAVCTEPRVNCDFLTPGKEGTFSALTWTAGLDYKVSADTLLYLASRRGYRPGGVNPPTSGIVVPDFDPEYVSDVELGIKSDWIVGSVPVRTNAALYYQDYSDAQVTVFRVISTGATFVNTSFIANAASARLWGAELEAQMKLTQRLELGVNFDYLNFKYTDFGPGANALDLGTTAKGNRPPYKYGVSAQYHLPLGAQIGAVSMRANWVWQDDSGDFRQNAGGLIPAYGLLNLSANWANVGGQPLDVSIFVSNATNEEYRTGGLGIYDLAGYNVTRYGEPRMYGLRLRYSFGEW